MNALITTPSAALTMSSREVAELTGKRHADVLRDARTMLEQLGQAERSFASSYQDSTGRPLPELQLPKDLTITLVAGYSAPLRHRIVTRWMDLEARAQPVVSLPNFTDPAEAAIAWAQEFKAKQAAEEHAAQLKQHLALAAPKVEAYDTLIHDRKDTLTEVARTIPGLNSRAINRDLTGLHLYRMGGRLRVYRSPGSSKFFYEGHEDSFGNREIFVTPAGRVELVRLAKAGVLTMRKGYTAAPEA